MEKLRKNDIQDVASYCGLVLLKEGMTISPLKLQKMLYYIQAKLLRFLLVLNLIMKMMKFYY